ncbi:MAG: ABC transporter substrate-binding protein [Chloroflexota bacterium]
MSKLGGFLKRAGLILLVTIVVLAVIVGAFVLWLRVEPEPVTECEAGFRLIEDGSSADCIPEVVDRAMAFGPMGTQFFLAIEFVPAARVGVLDQFVFTDMPGLLETWTAVTHDVPNIEGIPPNLESLLTTDTEVIISDYDIGSLSKAVERIAPIIELSFADSWKDNLLLTGDIIGEREAAEGMIADYEARVEILRAQFDDPSAITISQVVNRDGANQLYLPASLGGQIISEVGFSFPEAQLRYVEERPEILPERTNVLISDELIDVLDGDVIILYGLSNSTYTENDVTIHDTLFNELLNDPLFQQLGAVQNETVYQGGVYWSTPGIYSAHAILDDLFRYVAGVDPEGVAPNPLRLE